MCDVNGEEKTFWKHYMDLNKDEFLRTPIACNVTLLHVCIDADSYNIMTKNDRDHRKSWVDVHTICTFNEKELHCQQFF